MTPRNYLVSALATGIVASGLLFAAPADAADPMPRILLTGGAAEVSRTYTATADGRAYPAGSSPQYQWYRGSKDADPYSFEPIDGATSQRYTLTDADHEHTVKVEVKAMRDGRVVGTNDSSTSNWIMLNMAPPVFSGATHVGQVIHATLGDWAQEWHTSLAWRRTGNNIAGQNGVDYRIRPADAGKELSLLAIGDYTYPNGVHPIDRYASRVRVDWATKAIMKGASKSPGKLGLTAISYAQGAKQSTVRGRVAIYDGNRLLKRAFIQHGRKVIKLKGLRSGNHSLRMVFVSNPWFAGSNVTRTFHVR
jgi:hypothetical protein